MGGPRAAQLPAVGVTLDAGALIALERGAPAIVALIDRARALSAELAVPACVLAQVWRDGRRQARTARLIRWPITSVVALDADEARAVGSLCGHTGIADIADVSVVVCARRRGHTVITSDSVDMRRIDPTLPTTPP